MCDVVVRNIRDHVYDLIHPRDDLLQEIRFLADYFVHNNVRER